MLLCILSDYENVNKNPYISEPTTLLDSYIVGACMHLLGLPEINAEPVRKQPLFDILPEEERYKFISKIAKDILEKYIKITDGNSTKICL